MICNVRSLVLTFSDSRALICIQFFFENDTTGIYTVALSQLNLRGAQKMANFDLRKRNRETYDLQSWVHFRHDLTGEVF